MGKGMRAGKRPKQNRMSAGGMQQQLKQAQALQKQMEEAQAALESQEFTATAGGGAVSVTVTGKKEVTALTIGKDVVDPDDVEMLQDLISAAFNEAVKKVDDMMAREMSKLTSGLGLPPGML